MIDTVFFRDKYYKGLKLNFLKLLYENYNREEGQTAPITVEMLEKRLKSTQYSVKTIKNRLINEDKVIAIKKSKTGRGGFYTYEMPKELITIFDNIEGKGQKKKREATEVYFRASIDFNTKEIRYVKIGTTNSTAEKRRVEDKGANPDITTVLAVVPGGYETEKSFHEIFKEYRLSTEKEWFHYEGRLKLFIEEILKG